MKLKHENVATFAEEFATNLSPGGMFIRSRTPQPIGTPIKFEVQIAGGQRVLRGLAEVRWIREPGDPQGPAGMGLQFKQLDTATKALIDKMLAKRTPAPAPAAAPARAPAPARTPAPPQELPPEIAALEAELRSRYGEASQKSPTPAPITPLAPIAPLAPVSPPGSDADGGGFEIPLELASPSENDVDIPLSSLLEDAAPPAPEADEEILDLDVEAPLQPLSPAALEPLEEEIALDIEEGEAPAAPAPAPVRTKPATSPQALPQVRRRPEPPKEDGPPPVVLVDAPKPAAAKRKSGPIYLKPPDRLPEGGAVIGIDLGTTNSAVAFLKNGRPEILRSREGYNTLPSVVSLTTANKLLVSHRAKNQLVLNPNRTIYGAKRLVGRPYDSAIVQQVRERFHYEVVAGDDGKAAVQLGEDVLSLEEVQGLVLRECKEMAEAHLGTPVTRAVVTVPAYYSEPQREAVRRAGALAGLKVERVLNEPTAAALAFGLNRELDKKVLVYDLGGGTFDATVLKIEKNVFEVLGTGGDVFLGGIDFDSAIVDLLLAQFQATEKIPFQGDSVALSRVTEVAEKAKCALSERTGFDVHIPMLMMDANGTPRDLRASLTREQIEEAAMSLVTRTLDVVRDVLLDAKLKPSEVDEIILVGGQSRMPLVREKLKEMFGKTAHASVNADEAVALGAALYTGAVDKVSSVVLIDVLPMTIGIGMPGGGFKRVIERNTALPAQRSFAIATSKDNETAIEFQVFQGEDAHVAGNEYLGTVRLDGLPKRPKGLVKLAVTLRLDAECVLRVEAAELSTRKAINATLATKYTSDEIQQKLGITREAAAKVESSRARELEERGGGFWGFLKRVVGKK